MMSVCYGLGWRDKDCGAATKRIEGCDNRQLMALTSVAGTSFWQSALVTDTQQVESQDRLIGAIETVLKELK